MSLINDALRRAKEVQEQAPPAPPPDLPFRPIEPCQQPPRRRFGLLLPAALAVLALLALLIAWQWVRARGLTRPIEVTARRVPADAGAAMTARALEANRPLPPASTRSPAGAAADVLAIDAAPEPADSLAADVPETAMTNDVPVAAPAPPKPAPLRLQGIVFNPKRPSAMISGKTVFVGDKVGDLRVVAIEHESATLVGAGQTNVLSLAE